MKKEKKILLVGLNARYTHTALGIYSIKTYLSKKGIFSEAVEYTINDPYEHTLYNIIEKSPDVIGFSTYIWNIELVKRLSSDLKTALPDVTIVYGGPEAGYSNTQYPYADKIIVGEGESKFYEYLTGESDEHSFETLPFSYTEPFKPGKTVYYESSRGCPYRCSYCISSLEKNLRFKNIETVKKDLEFFIKNKVNKVKFVDRTFNIRKDSDEIFEFIINNASKTGFHFEIKPELFSEKTFNILKKAPKGLIQFEAGIQSLNEETLKAINRKNDTKLIFSNIKKLLSFGNIHIHTDLIAGLPYEDIESFKIGFDKLYSVGSDMLQLGFLKVLNGTQIKDECEKYEIKYSKYPPYQVISTKWMSVFDIMELKCVEDGLETLANKGFFKNSVKFMFENNDISPYETFKKFGILTKDEPPLSNPQLFSLFYKFYEKENLYEKEQFLQILKEDFKTKNPNKPLFKI